MGVSSCNAGKRYGELIESADPGQYIVHPLTGLDISGLCRVGHRSGRKWHGHTHRETSCLVPLSLFSLAKSRRITSGDLNVAVGLLGEPPLAVSQLAQTLSSHASLPETLQPAMQCRLHPTQRAADASPLPIFSPRATAVDSHHPSGPESVSPAHLSFLEHR